MQQRNILLVGSLKEPYKGFDRLLQAANTPVLISTSQDTYSNLSSEE